VFIVEDHSTSPTVEAANRCDTRRLVKKYGIKNFFEFRRAGFCLSLRGEGDVRAGQAGGDGRLALHLGAYSTPA
jgi:hypothetical protein